MSDTLRSHQSESKNDLLSTPPTQVNSKNSETFLERQENIDESWDFDFGSPPSKQEKKQAQNLSIINQGNPQADSEKVANPPSGSSN